MSYTVVEAPTIAGEGGVMDVERECAYCGRALARFGPGVMCVECNRVHDLCDACIEQATLAAQYGQMENAA